ncbi:MAG: hypothetical protein M1482_04790, partial [Chloroflexi bacterium]|nr:hypothetical protein [Chloroflexota bacterium]
NAQPTATRLHRNVDKLLADAHASELVRVAEFLEYIEALQDAGAREGEAPAEAGRAVRLMTVHKAKGLEFPVVVIADAARGRPSIKSPVLVDAEFGIVPEPARFGKTPIIFRLAKALEKEQRDAEDLRLLYVAATRAKEKLIVCGHQQARSAGTWLDRIASAVGVDLTELAGRPGEWLTVTLPESGQPVAALACQVDVDGGVAVPGAGAAASTGAGPLEPGEAPLYAPVGASQVEESDGKGDVEEEILRRLRRVTGRFRRTDGTLVGRLVHIALERSCFPGDAGYEALMRAAALEHGLVEERARNAHLSEASTLIGRLRSDARWQEIAAAPLRRHEVPFSYTTGGHPTTGSIDLLYRDAAARWHIVDFKTDAVGDDQPLPDETREKYTGQLRRYRDAVARLLGSPADAALCFLDYAGGLKWESVS